MDNDGYEIGAEQPPLTNWVNAPTCADLKKDLTEAQSSHDAQESRIDEWVDHLNIEGEAKIKKVAGASEMQPKLIRKQAEWRYPSLSEPFLNNSTLFNVAPSTWEDVQAAEQNMLVLNHQLNTKIDKVDFIDSMVRSAVDEGTAIIRVGWEFEEETNKVMQPILDFRPNPALAPVHEQLAQLKEENPSEYMKNVPDELKQAHDLSMREQIPMEPVVMGEEEVEVTKTTKNHPTLEVCDYHNVILDPSCRGDVDKANFLIYSFSTSLSQLKKSGRYKNLDRINIESNSILGTPDHSIAGETQDFNFSDNPRKKFIAYEYWGYWDFNDTGIAEPFVATWVGNTLIRLEENPFPDKKLPFIFIPLRPEKDSAYGKPDGELLIDNQKVVGAVTRGMIDILGKSANGQTGMRKDMLDATNKRKFQSGKDYEFNAGVDPRQGVYMHTFPEIPTSAQFILQQQTMEAESMTGVKAFNQGVNSESLGSVAAGIRGALDAASKRETSILRRLASGMVKVGRKIIAMNAEFLEDQEVVRITNDKFITIDREDLAGNFDLKLEISTAEEDAAKAQELAFMLQTMGNNADPGMVKIILRDIANLRKMPELAKEIEEYQPEPDPMQQQIQMLEIQKLQAEIAELQARTFENTTDGQLNTYKMQTEEAKARTLSSEADKKDLDFVEQESGVKQERAKELQGAQAEGNIRLEQVKQASKERSEYLKYIAQKNPS